MTYGKHAFVAVRPVDSPSLATRANRRAAGRHAGPGRWLPQDFRRDAAELQEELNADARAEARDAAHEDDWRDELP